MATVELNIITSGKIPGGLKRDIENIFRDCYRQFAPRVPYKVEVHIVDREANMRAVLKEDKIRLGVATSFEEDFVCSHDAWRGYPRVICCMEKLAKLDRLARPGAIRHEAAHSAIHGSPEYYIFRIPDECRHTAVIKGLDSPVLDQALYYVSMAVKDFEATRFLVQHDFIGCQFAFALSWLQPSGQDKSGWKAAQASRESKFIYMTTLLKPVLFAHPLLALPRSTKGISLEHQVQLARRMEELLEQLGGAEQNKLLNVANLVVEGATEDTHENVDSAMLQAMSLA